MNVGHYSLIKGQNSMHSAAQHAINTLIFSHTQFTVLARWPFAFSSIESENVKVHGNFKNEWASLSLRADAINCLLGNMEIRLKTK